MSRKPLIAGNWKMFPAPSELQTYKPREDVDVIVFPTFIDIPSCIDFGLVVGAQFGHPEESGPHTGDVSMKMVKDLGCAYVLCGHSERRQRHGESNEFVAKQVVAALKLGLHPIVCVGETEEERNMGREKEVVKEQIETVLSVVNQKLKTSNYELAIAYEPVWAIGTGKTATPNDAQTMHSFIRGLLSDISAFSHLRILYGGSVKPENAADLLSQPDIDGALVGGASLDPVKFQAVIEIAAKCTKV